MNWNELIIIYLACGSPFAVYYFLQNRNLVEKKFLYLKTLFRLFFWIPYGLRLVAQKRVFTKIYNLDFDGYGQSDAKLEAEIFSIQKQLETLLGKTQKKMTIYEFREIFERYTGLTLETNSPSRETSPTELEIFRITNHENKKLGEICLHRRNRRRLLFHQNLARLDFFAIVVEFSRSATEKQTLFDSAAKLFTLLNDFEANQMLADLSNKSLQIEEKTDVCNLEKESWNAERQKQSPASQISTNLQVLTVTANLSAKD